ncbi:MAG: hypothetical protein RL497_1638 [Pseudomonadota bacterium]|jgi:hypothetical protein
MENLRISETVRLKLLNKHGGLTRTDVEQCFANREGKFLVDNREPKNLSWITQVCTTP